MLDLRLRHEGGGRFQTATRLDLDLSSQLEHGETLRARITRKRSVQQNEFFHALIETAHENQRGGQIMPSWRHLKSHLLIAVGHCDEARIALHECSAATAAIVAKGMTAELRRRFDTVETSYDRRRHEIVMRFAKSVAFSEVSRERMAEIVDAVTAIICSDIVPGTTPEQLFDIAKRRAAFIGDKQIRGE